MAVDLSQFESGSRFTGDYEAALGALQDRLEKIQAAYITRRASAVIAIEGWDAAGKGGVIKRLTACWDPRWFDVWSIGAPTPDEAGRHFLWRFWRGMPAPGHIAVFDRTWYGRVLVERVEGLCSEADWRRAYDDINAFEDQQREAGTRIVKLFFHVTQKEQDKRLQARLADPWKRWKTGPEDYRNRSKREEYLTAYAEMFERCNTRWAPWTIIDGNNKKAARIAALTAIADQLSAQIDMAAPSLDPSLAQLAAEALGKDEPPING